MNAVVRVGATVQRTAGPWTPTIHRLLRHLEARGLAWVPQPLGTTEDGLEVLTFLPGTVVAYPMPAWIWSDAVLVDAANHLAAIHRATSDFDAAGGCWQLPTRAPVEVVCHNDFAPHNLVFDERRAIAGVIDWDTACPGPRVWDLAYLAYRLVPLAGPANPDASDGGDLGERRRRLGVLCRAYGHGLDPASVAATAVRRLHALADLTAARATAGAHELSAHVPVYRDDAGWLGARLDHLR